MPFRFFCSISMYGKARLLNCYLNLVFFDIHDAAFIIAVARCTRAIIKGKKIGTKACLFVVISIAGNCSKIFLKKSFRPLPVQIEPDFSQQVSAWFNCAFDALENDSRGVEFIVRENFSRICFCLYEKFESRLNVQAALSDQDTIRIQKMLNFLHRNFADNLSLKEIAGAADVSERECLRCFKKMLQTSPVQYLLKYRVMQGAEMLLANPASSISEVAAYCGFESPSNFAKMFKRFYSCTPREYRHIGAI